MSEPSFKNQGNERHDPRSEVQAGEENQPFFSLSEERSYKHYDWIRPNGPSNKVSFKGIASIECHPGDQHTGDPRDIATAMQIHRKALDLLPTQSSERDFFVENSQGFELGMIAQGYGDPYFPNLGDTSHALDFIRQSISFAEECHRKDPKSDYTTHLDYASNTAMADLLWARGETAEALNFQRRAEAMLNGNAPTSQPNKGDLFRGWAPQSQVVREEEAMATVRRANLLAELGQQNAALDALRE